MCAVSTIDSVWTPSLITLQRNTIRSRFYTIRKPRIRSSQCFKRQVFRENKLLKNVLWNSSYNCLSEILCHFLRIFATDHSSKNEITQLLFPIRFSSMCVVGGYSPETAKITYTYPTHLLYSESHLFVANPVTITGDCTGMNADWKVISHNPK